MKKIILIFQFGVIICVCSYLFAQSTIEEAFPDSKTILELTFEGKLQYFAVIEVTEDIVLLTQEQNKYLLYYLNRNGAQLWEKKHSFEGSDYCKIHGLQVSKNGETIVVQALDESSETQQSWVYDKDGNLLFSDVTAKGWYYPSPLGNYLTYQPTNNFTPLVIYDCMGNVIPINVPLDLQKGRQIHRFCSENEILIYKEHIKEETINAELILATFPDFKIIWRHKLDTSLWLIDFNERNCAICDDYIAIQGTKRPGSIYLFDKIQGNLLWKNDDPKSNHGIMFFRNGKLLVSLSSNNFLFLIDTEKGTILNRIQLFDWGGIDSVPKFYLAENNIVIYGRVNIKDKSFGMDKIVSGRYSSLISFDTNWKIEKKKLISNQLLLYKSKLDSTVHLIGRLNKENKILIKKMEK